MNTEFASYHIDKMWTRPTPPSGFDELVACVYQGDTVLDFVNRTSRSFASEEEEVDIAWPWLDGYLPMVSDWALLGIDVIDFR